MFNRYIQMKKKYVKVDMQFVGFLSDVVLGSGDVDGGVCDGKSSDAVVNDIFTGWWL